MRISSGMSESEFIEAIDAYFKFDSAAEYEEAVRIACNILDNATLMIGYELATQSSYANMDVNLRLLNLIREMRPSPIVVASLPIIESLLKSEQARPEDINRLLEECEKDNSVWNALGILECADESLADKCEEIRDAFRKTS